MDHLYEQFDLIEEITRNDGSQYYEISNIDQNGFAELAVNNGLIKSVRILVINIPRKFELALLAVTALALALWVFAPPGPVTLVACAVAAVLHAVRLWMWHPWVTFKRPILWILHAAYAWLPIGFVLLALAQVGWVSYSLAVHAFGVGVTGGLIIGMVTRTARGHTGRPLQVSRPEVLAYAFVMLAAVLRVLVPAVAPALYTQALAVAAGLWAVAFALYLVVYTPWLMRTRLDGKDG